MFLYFLSLFSHREGGGGTKGNHVGGCRLRRSYQASFIVHSVAAEEVKWLGSTDAVKRHSKNDFYTSSDSSHNAPYKSQEYGNRIRNEPHNCRGVCQSSGFEDKTHQRVKATQIN
jgi:hypothetical protein